MLEGKSEHRIVGTGEPHETDNVDCFAVSDSCLLGGG